MHKVQAIEPHDSPTPQEPRDVLDQIIQEGARRMLQAALENEVREYLEKHKDETDENGHRCVVGNGYLPERDLLTGAGAVRIRQPRVRDERENRRFSSSILPPYMRRVPSIDALIPALYLKGISTGDFTEALQAILGENAAGLSATNIVRLKKRKGNRGCLGRVSGTQRILARSPSRSETARS